MNTINKFLTAISIAVMPIIAYANVNTPVATNMPVHTDTTVKTVTEEKVKWYKDDEKISDAVRTELKNYNEKKRAIKQECRKKQDDLRKSLSPEAIKIHEARRERRKEYREDVM